MSDELTTRLNAILPRIVSDDFLSGSGIGNEIAFYVFDYDPEDELRVRPHIQFLLNQIPKSKPGLRVTHVNLFDLAIDHLRSRELLEPCFDMQRERGDKELLEALSPELDPERFAEVFNEAAKPHDSDLVLVSGIGSVWPLLRTHQLISVLHSKMGRTPVVFFYPGRYDGKTLRLFGKPLGSTADPYYRAFKLVERGNSHAH
jgi:Domain of unknown function (DUF1788)